MNRQRIQILVGLIPPGAAYRAAIPRECSTLGMPEEVDLYAHAAYDLQFGWGFVQTFAQLERPLPSAVDEPELLRAYATVRYQHQDPDVLAALCLQSSANYLMRIVVCCLLTLKWDYEAIARYTGLRAEVCRIYEVLFWNMRDRHWIDLMAHVFPAGRQVEFLPGYAVNESLMNLALRAAVQQGLPAIEELLGLRTVPADSDVTGSANALIAQTLNSANAMLQWGFEH